MLGNLQLGATTLAGVPPITVTSSTVTGSATDSAIFGGGARAYGRAPRPFRIDWPEEVTFKPGKLATTDAIKPVEPEVVPEQPKAPVTPAKPIVPRILPPAPVVAIAGGRAVFAGKCGNPYVTVTAVGIEGTVTLGGSSRGAQMEQGMGRSDIRTGGRAVGMAYINDDEEAIALAIQLLLGVKQ